MSLENKLEKLTLAVEKLTATMGDMVTVRGIDRNASEFVATPLTIISGTEMKLKVAPVPEEKLKITPPPTKENQVTSTPIEEPEIQVTSPPSTELVSSEKAAEIVNQMKTIGKNLGDNTPIWDIIHSYNITNVSSLLAKDASGLLAKLNTL